MMKFWLVIILMFIATTVAAQGTNPDLNGEWSLEAQSNREGNVTPQPADQGVVLKIVQRDPEIILTFERTVQPKGTRVVTYFTDGRGEKNEAAGLTTTLADMPQVTVKSKTKWKKNKLVINGGYRQVLAGRFYEVKQDEEWELAEDGSLVHHTTLKFEDTTVQFQGSPRERGMTISPPPAKFKQVYRKI